MVKKIILLAVLLSQTTAFANVICRGVLADRNLKMTSHTATLVIYTNKTIRDIFNKEERVNATYFGPLPSEEDKFHRTNLVFENMSNQSRSELFALTREITPKYPGYGDGLRLILDRRSGASTPQLILKIQIYTENYFAYTAHLYCE